MKVTGPGAGPPDAGAADQVAPAEPPKAQDASRAEGSGKAFADKLDQSQPVEHEWSGPAGAGAAQAPSRIDTSDIAADLKAGRIGPEAAVEKLLDRVLDQQLGPDAPPAMRDRLREALRDTLESDPLLGEKLRL